MYVQNRKEVFLVGKVIVLFVATWKMHNDLLFYALYFYIESAELWGGQFISDLFSHGYNRYSLYFPWNKNAKIIFIIILSALFYMQ